MTMFRPLMNKKIEQLEQLFNDAAGDSKILRRLADELACRSTARASSLLSAVQSSFGPPDKAPVDAAKSRTKNESTQLTLLPEALKPRVPETSITVPVEPQTQGQPAEAIRMTFAPVVATEAPAQELIDVPNSALTVEAAYRSLKISSSASWSAIERARREIVQKASPEALVGESSSSRATIVKRAAIANEASARLWRERYPTLA